MTFLATSLRHHDLGNDIFRWGRGFPGICFSLVPNVFPSYSHEVPTKFPICSYSTSTLSHMVGPNFHSHVFKLERWATWEHVCFYFVTQGPKRCFYWGVPNVTKNMGDAWGQRRLLLPSSSQEVIISYSF